MVGGDTDLETMANYSSLYTSSYDLENPIFHCAEVNVYMFVQ